LEENIFNINTISRGITMNNFKNKVAIITGGSSGIGRATALRLAEYGARIVLLSRDMEKLKSLENELKTYNVQVLSLAADTTDRQQVKSAVTWVIEAFKDIDMLVCCAGQYHRGLALELDIKDFERMMSVNFYGTLNCIYEVLPLMRQRGGGNITVVSSVDGKKGLPLDGAYVASKFAISGFLDVLRQELRGTGIALSTIFPGRVDTPMIESLEVSKISSKISPDRVARAILSAMKKNKGEVYVPYFTSKALVLLNGVSCRIGDLIIRVFRLEGWEKHR
jgi:short-subunit dehydrogenase